MTQGGAATFAELWARAVETAGTRPFLTFEAPDHTVTDWTYAEFDRLTSRVAATFAAAGAGPDAPVHLALTNSPAFVAGWIAATRLGAAIVPSDPMATTTELADHIERTGPAIGLCAHDRADVYRAALGSTPEVVVVELGEADTELAALTTAEPVDLPVVDDPLARAAVMFTSGTTGRPKGVVITQANYAFAGTTMADAAQLGPADRQLVVLPMFHANAQYYSFASAIAVGASVALMHTFSASGFVGQAARHGATHASLFAGPMRMILARGGPLPAGSPPLRLRHCWFAQNLAADQYDTLSEWFGCRPRQLYGMTETIPAVLTDRPDDPRPDTMGDVTRGCAVDVIDGAGGSCRPGEVGEIVVGGRRGIELFAEYLDDRATTEASFRDGWLLTGDRAWRDDDGRFHFDGRRADVLKVAGENVSVIEVESALTEHPAVLDAVVVGAPDPIRDEVPMAFVVPAASPGVAILDDPAELAAYIGELTAWAESRLGKAKRPQRYEVVADLPRTSVGKIRKFLLADAARGRDHSIRLPNIRHPTPHGGLDVTTLDRPTSPFVDALLAELDGSTADVADAVTLPAELYTAPEVLEFERDALYAKEWLCAGRAERIPNPGDWFTVTICDEPIIVARDKAGEIQAMSAVCQHRAMQVCDGEGNSTTFKCPYHHWNYALDGRLLGAPAMERTADFDKSDYGLPRLAVELWQGFVFVNLDPGAEPLAPTLTQYEPYLANYDLADAVCPGTFTLENLPWNWKVMFENFNDGYHANRLHQYVQDFCPSNLSEFPVEYDPDSNVVFRAGGYTHIDGGFNATHHAIMPVFPKLTDEERTRSTFALIPPTLCFGTAPDQCFFFLVRPTGPETIDVEIGYIFHASALDDPLFDHKLKLTDVGVQVFVEQDQDATTKVQRGLRSRFAPRGRYSWQEESHVRFNRWLVQRYRRELETSTAGSG